jgi:hypothetical protein
MKNMNIYLKTGLFIGALTIALSYIWAGVPDVVLALGYSVAIAYELLGLYTMTHGGVGKFRAKKKAFLDRIFHKA